jgi:hypothetical protein
MGIDLIELGGSYFSFSVSYKASLQFCPYIFINMPLVLLLQYFSETYNIIVLSSPHICYSITFVNFVPSFIFIFVYNSFWRSFMSAKMDQIYFCLSK